MVPAAVYHLFGRLHHGGGEPGFDERKIAVRERPGALDFSQGADECPREPEVAYRKVVSRPRRVDAVVRLSGDFVFAQGVAFHP